MNNNIFIRPEKVVLGVCSKLASKYSIKPLVLRTIFIIIFIITTVLIPIAGILLYIILALLLGLVTKKVTIKTFENEIISSCELLGKNTSTLFQYLGHYDGICTNSSGTRFMYYNKIKTNFIVNEHNIVTCFNVPSADADGHEFFENSSYYSINGICQRMTQNEVREIMGEPDIKCNSGNELDEIQNLLFWNYSSNIRYNKSGNKYLIRFSFDDENSDEFRLSHFIVDLI
jgi:phage shock protein PspC (stress-responsive transcriptional regulator)